MKLVTWRLALLACTLALPALGCGRSGFYVPGGGKLKLEVRIGSSPATYDLLELTWAGTWLGAPQGGSQVGAMAAGDARQVAPAEVIQQGGLVTFPNSAELRPGCWQISTVVVGYSAGAATSLLTTLCNVEVFSDELTGVTFAEGAVGCTATIGGACTV